MSTAFSSFHLPTIDLPDRFVSDTHYLQWEFERVGVLLRTAHDVVGASDPVAAWTEIARFNQHLHEHVRQLRHEHNPSLSFEDMVNRFGLSALEEDVLLVMLAQSLNEVLRQQMLVAGGVSGNTVTVGFVAELVRSSMREGRSELSWCRPNDGE